MSSRRTIALGAAATTVLALTLAPSAAYADAAAPAVFLPLAVVLVAIVGAVVLGVVAATVLVFIHLRRRKRGVPLAPVPPASPGTEPPATIPGDPDA